MRPNLQLAPLLSQLTIQTKSLTTEKLNIHSDFAWAQRAYTQEVERQYNAGKPVRVIVLKARQLGISTATEAILFWWTFIHPGTNGLVVAHEASLSEELFGKTRLYWETWPLAKMFTAKYATRRELTWSGTRSSLRVATAKNLQSGRGRTLHAVHLSECAFYPDPEQLMVGLSQTIPNKHGTIIALESTANGIGNWFHDMWLQAEAGKSDYVPLFFPWWKHYEYKTATTLSEPSELDADERYLHKLGASYEAIAWRRWAIPNLAGNDLDYFMQEYPATPTEAFIATGTNVFPLRKLDDCYAPHEGYRGMLVEDGNGRVHWISDNSGSLVVYKKPSKNRERRTDRYFVSGDPSMTIQGDPACIQVINRATMEQVAVWHGQIDPINFAKEMMMIGKWYHDAMLCPEVEGGGQATVATILNASYPNVWQHRWADKAPGKTSISYGWATNWQRKNWSVGRLKFLIGDDSIVIHDKETYNQLRNYIVHPNGDMACASNDIHDDAVMALAIGVTASMTEGPFAEEDQRVADILDLFGQQEGEAS